MTEADALHEACELFEQGAEDDAARAARAADGLLGSAAEALNAIGTAFAKRAKVALARRAYEASAAADPSLYKPHANLAKLAKDAGDLDGAIVALAKATSLAPNQARLWTRLGAARLEAGASAEAADALAKAAALEGTEVARLGAAAAYAQALDVEKVVDLLRDATGRAALALRAEAVAEIARRGRNGRPPVYSIGLLQDELAVSPGNPALLHRLAISHFGVGDVSAALRELEQIDDSVATAAQASDLLFTELHAGIWSRTERLARHVAWAERHAPPSKPLHHLALGARPPRLRVGFLSGDLHPTHAVFRFARAAFFGLDPKRFEVLLFDTRASGRWDASAPFRVCDVSRASDAGVAELIAKEEIHILVDLSGHTGGNSLVALRHKPAPVLATWLGYPTTTGLATVDYRITDAFADPP
ncbi:MAG TPA: hypothetical protein VL400_21585, partial [Polyangiaceae bacterium]|nr:hypothetical protein [Polyangiaceae bacterium]